MPLKGMFQWWRTLGAPEKDVVVGGAPQWALDLEPLAKTPVKAVMPLKRVFQWWRTLGAPEKGVAVSLGFPLDWTADSGHPDNGRRKMGD